MAAALLLSTSLFICLLYAYFPLSYLFLHLFHISLELQIISLFIYSYFLMFIYWNFICPMSCTKLYHAFILSFCYRSKFFLSSLFCFCAVFWGLFPCLILCSFPFPLPVLCLSCVYESPESLEINGWQKVRSCMVSLAAEDITVCNQSQGTLSFPFLFFFLLPLFQKQDYIKL